MNPPATANSSFFGALATRSAAIRCLPVALALTLVGCDSTSFQSPPGNEFVECDAAWKGSWRLLGESAPGHLLVVGDDCQASEVATSVDPSTWVSDESVQLRFAEHNGQRYVVTVEEPPVGSLKAQSADDRPDRSGTPSYTIARYVSGPSSISVWMVDTRAAARMVVDGLLLGHVSRHKDGLRVFVQGTPDSTLHAVELPGMFQAEPTFLLERSTGSVNELDADRPVERNE